MNFISDSTFSIKVCRSPLVKYFPGEIFSLNVVSDEFVRSILKASPLKNPFLTLGG